MENSSKATKASDASCKTKGHIFLTDLVTRSPICTGQHPAPEIQSMINPPSAALWHLQMPQINTNERKQREQLRKTKQTNIKMSFPYYMACTECTDSSWRILDAKHIHRFRLGPCTAEPASSPWPAATCLCIPCRRATSSSPDATLPKPDADGAAQRPRVERVDGWEVDCQLSTRYIPR